MTPWERVETIGDATLYLGDCLRVMPFLDGIDAVVTDPPYGIGINKSHRLSTSRGHAGESWDDEPVDAPRLHMLLHIGRSHIIWGGNYFPLPPTRCPLVWDKNNAGRDFADVEVAWSDLDSVARRIVFRPMNMDGGKLHPTQKPVEVMRWCLGHIPDARTILDPFMGSGTTGVAAVKMGRRFIGIEREPRYFDIACCRIEEAMREPDMLVTAERREAEQTTMFADAATK